MRMESILSIQSIDVADACVSHKEESPYPAGMQLPLEDDPRPPYVQAAEVLRRQIQAGALKPGEKLPSARELQAKYGIASSTVQNALRVLKHEGLIYSVQGRGSFVRSSAEAERQDEAKQAPEAERQGNEQGPRHLLKARPRRGTRSPPAPRTATSSTPSRVECSNSTTR